ncbi:MAG TPA: septal ring lytic transglycosylase RlpA family protein [Puia sp.]|nr:septal ring lytic transglycosylase RlpA family protein [Puia sp.]
MNKFLLFAVILTVCMPSQGSLSAQGVRTVSHKNAIKKNTRIHYGIASFYANKFNGRHTASGEIFSQEKLTAASNLLPLNTWVRVTNLHNRKEVIVKINDRMHFRNRRLIDLSHAAAKKLGYTGWGLAKVKVELLGKRKREKELAIETNRM